MFTLDLDRRDYQLRQIVRGVFRFELPEARSGVHVAVGLAALREGEIVFDATRTLDGPKDLSSGTYSFELRLPEDVKGPGFMKRVKQALKRAQAAEVTWEVWGIIDREIVCKTGFNVIEDEVDEHPEVAGTPPDRQAAQASVLSRLSIPPPDYAPSGRADLPGKGKKKPVEPPPRLKDVSEVTGASKIKFCEYCGAKEEDPESDYCGRCGRALA